MSRNRLFLFDEALRAHHRVRFLIGVDEAGRGPLAGPVVAAAMLLGPEPIRELDGVRDSKSLTPQRRSVLFEAIRRFVPAVGVGWAMPAEIDRHNILQATFFAMRRAVDQLMRRIFPSPYPLPFGERREVRGFDLSSSLIVVDGNKTIPGIPHPQKALVKGDVFSQAIAGASIVAKVVRDRWMERLDGRYPGYGFSLHKGYGTAAHVEALGRLGPSPVHRKSFEPVAQMKLL